MELKIIQKATLRKIGNFFSSIRVFMSSEEFDLGGKYTILKGVIFKNL
jgi:hypothetical protein